MKSFLLIICICICTSAFAQGKGGNPGAGGIRREGLNSLRLSKEQKNRIANLIKKEEVLHQKDMQELDKILTEEQKKKLAEWRKKRAQADSTSNSKNHIHD
jgi:Spy/CpxP family protein refolding chaperone